jgi:hypothetical protein
MSKPAKQSLVWRGVLILIGVLWVVNQFVELSPWRWAALLAGAGLGAFGLYLADRSDGLLLLAAYVLWAVAVLFALVPSHVLRDEAVAIYVELAIALPLLVISVRDRARWWALIPAYVLLAVAGVIGLTESGLFSDDLVSLYVLFAIAIPFFVIYARNRKRWWAPIPGGILALIGLSFLILGRGTVVHSAAFALLVVGAWILVRAFVGRGPSGEAALRGSGEPAPSGPEGGEPLAA